MHAYKPGDGQDGLLPWPSLEQTFDVKILEGEPVQSGRVDFGGAVFDRLVVFREPLSVHERRVRRTATHGDWRLWFTDVDVNVFRPITSRWLNRNGYDRDDWSLANPEAIDPASSVEYVRSLFAEAGASVDDR